jgi:hypothetical protein
MSDAYCFWDVRVERFVDAFRGADRQLARAVARAADVVDTMFSDLTIRTTDRRPAQRARRVGARCSPCPP